MTDVSDPNAEPAGSDDTREKVESSVESPNESAREEKGEENNQSQAPPAPQPGELRVPPGARCATHPDEDARYICSRCGSFAGERAIFSRVPRREVCQNCAEGGFPLPVPWERRRELGYRRAFIDNTKAVMFNPVRFFRTPSVEAADGPALGYGIVIYTIGQLMSAVVIVLGMLAAAGGTYAMIGNTQQNLALGVAAYFGLLSICILPMTVLQAPVAGGMGVAIGTAMSHGILKLFKATRAPFTSTMQVISYSNAPYVLYVVPCVGPLVAIAWTSYIEMVGLRELHGVSTDKAALATFGYRALFFFGILLLYGGLIGLSILTAPGGRL